jgi:hypothetical protein
MATRKISGVASAMTVVMGRRRTVGPSHGSRTMRASAPRPRSGAMRLPVGGVVGLSISVRASRAFASADAGDAGRKLAGHFAAMLKT